MSHNKYHTTDYTRKWTAREVSVLMTICEMLKKIGAKKKDWWVRTGVILGRSTESCHHKWRTVITRSDRTQVGGKNHEWTTREVRNVKKLAALGVIAPKIARLLGVTKYAVWHRTKKESENGRREV